MANLSHQLRDSAREGCDSPYARMVPGLTGTPSVPPNVHKRPTPAAKDTKAIGKTGKPRSSPWHALARCLIPHTQADNRVLLYQLSFLDLLVLLAFCFLPSEIFILFAFSEGLYKTVGAPAVDEIPVLARSSFFAMALVLVAAWNDMQPLAAFAALATSLTGLVLWREARRRVWNKRFRKAEPRNVLIVGAGQTGRAIARALQEDPLRGSTVVGFLDDNTPLSPQVLGRIGDLDWLARAQFIDEVILAVPGEPALVRETAEVAFRNHLDIRFVPDLPPGAWPDAGIERIGGIPVIPLHRESLPSETLFLKRVMDVAGSLFGLLLIGPLIGLLALLTRLDSPGPVFYSAERTGTKGRPFRCYKFRSMIAGADQMQETLRDRNQREGPIFKLADDPRITRFGRFLRRYSLDELPQLWNVLLGEMSLVGPRPHPVDQVNRYELHHYRRLDMKPGMTGLWQISARHSPSFDLNMHLDLTYIENWTLVLDLHILLSTVPVLFAPKGA